MFETYTLVSRINRIVRQSNSSGMKVTVNVDTPSTQRLRMDGNVREDYLITMTIKLNNIGTNVIKVRSVLFQLEDVMISLDKNFSTIQSGHCLDGLPLHGKIAEDIDTILGINQGIVIGDDSFVMLFNGSKGT